MEAFALVPSHGPVVAESARSIERLRDRLGRCYQTKTEGRVSFTLALPRDAQRGRWVIPVEVTYHGRRLGQFREAVVVVA
jgi:hypothetical protein